VQWFPGVSIPGLEETILYHDFRDSGLATGPALEIKTLEGTMYALPGDWIITGVNGEKYPCKPDIFAKTYEAI
jgi:hypothetical protein